MRNKFGRSCETMRILMSDPQTYSPGVGPKVSQMSRLTHMVTGYDHSAGPAPEMHCTAQVFGLRQRGYLLWCRAAAVRGSSGRA